MTQFYTPTQLQRLTKECGLRPSKDFGQNYLLRPEPVEEMLAVANVSKEDVVVEVGPGFGVLTLALADTAKQVVAFEIEKKMAGYWNKEKKQYPNIQIVWGDALKMLPAHVLPAGYKVVANIPYQITSPLLRLFLEEMPVKPESLTLLVQKEVAERVVAGAGDASILSLSVQYYGDPEIVAEVPRHFFWPAPKVDSAILHIKLNPVSKKDALEADTFFALVKAGFSNRRKLLIKNLENAPAYKAIDWGKVWQNKGWDRLRRAQELSLEEWKDLYQTIK